MKDSESTSRPVIRRAKGAEPPLTNLSALPTIFSTVLFCMSKKKFEKTYKKIVRKNKKLKKIIFRGLSDISCDLSGGGGGVR